MGWILRVFGTREVTDLLPVFKSLLLPHFEYACQLWFPSDMDSIRTLESVQRTFTSRLTGMDQYNYWQRLEKLSLYSVERRRKRYIIIYIRKLIQGMVPSVRGLHGEELVVVHSARRGRLISVPPLKRVTPRLSRKLEASFMIKGPRLFNYLPQELRAINCTLNSFKKRLVEVLSWVPDRPVLSHYYQTARTNSRIEQVRHSIKA